MGPIVRSSIILLARNDGPEEDGPEEEERREKTAGVGVGWDARWRDW